MEQGLAQQLSAQAPQGAGGMGQGGPTIEDVIAMLMQGADPNELLEMGISEDMLLQALQMIEQQQGGGAVPQQAPTGLAARAAM